MVWCYVGGDDTKGARKHVLHTTGNLGSAGVQGHTEVAVALAWLRAAVARAGYNVTYAHREILSSANQ